jgi:hypothetical protein
MFSKTVYNEFLTIYYGVTMIKSFFLTSALLAPAFAYAATPSADLSVNVVPAAHTGCLAGSFCPPGLTMTNVLDEEMSKGYLSSQWHALGGGPLGCECFSDGVHGWSFPGDGTLTMNGWDASGAPGNTSNLPGGITFEAFPYNNPGFYEMKAIVGSDHNGWFTLAGSYGVCPPTPPGELDYVENVLGRGPVHTYYSDSCGTLFDLGTYPTDVTQVHVYGVDSSPTRGITMYLDGVPIGNLPASYFESILPLCTDGSPNTTNRTCGTALWLQAGGPGTSATPMKVYWLRYYTEMPQ